MLFNSFSYLLVFLPLLALLLGAVRRALGVRAAQGLLIIASLTFYGWSKPQNLPFLIGSIFVNWALSHWMMSTRDDVRKRRILIVGLALNVVFLSLFKYVNFFLSGVFALGLAPIKLPDWEFPLGISFFTLQQVMYLVDCYEGLTPPSPSCRCHTAFVSFFPYVTSGPLARSKNMIRQFCDSKSWSSPEHSDSVAAGVYLLSLGLFKKIIFADSFARVADIGFTSAHDCSTLEAWAFSVAYTLQIYFDFSGYSDMAIGSARILGFEIPKNFNSPYKSKSIIEFWQRWHISLSGFITTYLYTPILRSFKKATLRTASVATLLSMAIAGLWHGPSWNFILFGLMHGVALVINQYWKKTKRKLPFGVAWGLTFCFVNISFIFFRARDLPTAIHLSGMLIPRHGLLGTTVLQSVRTLGIVTLVPPLLGGLAAAFIGKNSDELTRDFRPSVKTALGTAAALLASLLYLNSTILKQFVYFNF